MADMNVLVYKFDELDSCSAKMGQVIESLERLKDASKNVRSSVSDYWQGVTYDEFAGRLTKLDQAIAKLLSQIRSNKEKLDKAISLEKENEQTLTSQTVGRLSADNIF